MNRLETADILAVLKAAYPQFYNGLSPKEANKIVDLWAEMFKDEPVMVVAVAVKAMIASRTNTFPPNIGEVKEQITKMCSSDVPLGAFGIVRHIQKLVVCLAIAPREPTVPDAQRPEVVHIHPAFFLNRHCFFLLDIFALLGYNQGGRGKAPGSPFGVFE